MLRLSANHTRFLRLSGQTGALLSFRLEQFRTKSNISDKEKRREWTQVKTGLQSSVLLVQHSAGETRASRSDFQGEIQWGLGWAFISAYVVLSVDRGHYDGSFEH